MKSQMVSIGKAFLSNHKKHCENHLKKNEGFNSQQNLKGKKKKLAHKAPSRVQRQITLPSGGMLSCEW